MQIPKGTSYGISVEHLGTTRTKESESSEGGEEPDPDFDYRAWIDDYARPKWKSGSSTPSGKDFFVDNGGGLLQRRFLGDGENPTNGKTAILHVPNADLDIDVNRDGVMNLTDDWYEQDSTLGPTIDILSGDMDRDGVRDNYDFDGIDGASFEPVRISLSANLAAAASPSSIFLRFNYDGADASGSDSDGLFRLWRRDAYENRSRHDLVEAGRMYSAASLGLVPGGSRTFFLEAVNPTRRWKHFDPIEMETLVLGSWQGQLVDTIHARGTETVHRAFVAADQVSADSPAVTAVYEFMGDDFADYDGQTVHFEILDANGQPTGTAATASLSNGLARAEIELPSNKAGDTFQVRAEFESNFTDLASVSIVAGEASQVQWAAYVGGQYVGETIASPPQRDSSIDVRLTATFRDQHGNLIADGTPVLWNDLDAFQDELPEVDGSEGLIGETTSGRSTLSTTADRLPAILQLAVAADSFESTTQLVGTELTISFTFDNLILYTEYGTQTTEVTAHVVDAFGRPAPDGTPIQFFDTKNTIESADAVTTEGKAKARISIDGRERSKVVGKIIVGAQAAGFYAKNNRWDFIQVSRSPSTVSNGPRVWVENKILSPDAGDGHTETRERLDGTPVSITTERYTNVRLESLDANTSYRIRIEGNRDGTVYLTGGETDHLDIPLGRTEFGVYLFVRGNSPRMTNVKLVLEQWNGVLSGWDEVNTTESAVDVVVGNRDVVTNLEYATEVASNMLWGAIAGSDDIDAALAGDIALSFMPVVGAYTDARDIAKSLWSLTPMSTREFDARELTIGALGLIGEFFPPADVAIDGVRAFSKIAKNANMGAFLLAVEPLFREMAVEIWDHYWSGNSTTANPPSNNIASSSATNAMAASSAVDDLVDQLINVVGQIGPNSEKAANVMAALLKNASTHLPATINEIGSVGERRASIQLRTAFETLGGPKFADSLLHAADTLSSVQLKDGLQAIAAGIRYDKADRVKQAFGAATADEIGDVLRSFGKLSTFENVSHKVDVATILPRMVATGLLPATASSARQGFEMVKQIADDFEGLMTHNLASEDIGEWFKLWKGKNNSNQIQYLRGVLYELQAARSIADQFGHGKTIELAFRDSNFAVNRTLDVRISDGVAATRYEIRHGVGGFGDDAKQRIIDQVFDFAASPMEKLYLVVPDDATRIAIESIINQAIDSSERLEEAVANGGGVAYLLQSSVWR